MRVVYTAAVLLLVALMVNIHFVSCDSSADGSPDTASGSAAVHKDAAEPLNIHDKISSLEERDPEYDPEAAKEEDEDDEYEEDDEAEDDSSDEPRTVPILEKDVKAAAKMASAQAQKREASSSDNLDESLIGKKTADGAWVYQDPNTGELKTTEADDDMDFHEVFYTKEELKASSTMEVAPDNIMLDDYESVHVVARLLSGSLYQCADKLVSTKAELKRVVQQVEALGNVTFIESEYRTRTDRSRMGEGVSAVLLTSEGYIAINSWPTERYVSLDIMGTVDEENTMKLARLFEELLYCNHLESIWTLTPRGGVAYLGDLATLHMVPMMRRLIHYKKTMYQSIAVYDVPAVGHVISGAIQARGRVLYLDGTMQVAESDEYIYHEALIHPPLLAHPHPKRVMVVGGGDGAALREVLRHKTVVEAVMVELDEEVSKASREHMPTLHNGSFEDPRSNVQFTDGLKFINESTDGSYDVIVVDILDPEFDIDNQTHAQFSNPLFSVPFYQNILKKLHPVHGVLVTNCGGVDPKNAFGGDEQCDCCQVLRNMRLAGFLSVSHYQAYVPSFQSPWIFAVATVGPCPTLNTEMEFNETAASERAAAALATAELPPTSMFATRNDFPAKCKENIFAPVSWPELPEKIVQASKNRISGDMQSYDGYEHLRMFILPMQLRNRLNLHRVHFLANDPPKGGQIILEASLEDEEEEEDEEESGGSTSTQQTTGTEAVSKDKVQQAQEAALFAKINADLDSAGASAAREAEEQLRAAEQESKSRSEDPKEDL